MNILQAIVLGLIQGLTEFIPVSSSGHLVLAQHLFGKVTSGAVKIRIDQRFPLDQVADAHRALESRATTGATVLLP